MRYVNVIRINLFPDFFYFSEIWYCSINGCGEALCSDK